MKTNFETKRFLKKTVAAACVISMLAPGACAKSNDTAQTLEAGEITGKVTQIEDTTVTLALGTLTEKGMQGGEDQPPQMPQDSEQNGAALTEQSGDAQGQPPEKPSGEQDAASGGGQNDSRQKSLDSAQSPSENAQDDSADGNEQKPADNGQSAVWNLTGDYTITSLVNHGMINFNGHTITLADGTVLSD